MSVRVCVCECELYMWSVCVWVEHSEQACPHHASIILSIMVDPSIENNSSITEIFH